jgi:hypothetical protein
MLLVGMYLQIIKKQFSFQSRVKPSVLVLQFKQDLTFVVRDICPTCYLMVAQGLKLESKVFMKMLLEIQIEVILLRQSRKPSRLLKIVLTKLLLI